MEEDMEEFIYENSEVATTWYPQAKSEWRAVENG